MSSCHVATASSPNANRVPPTPPGIVVPSLTRISVRLSVGVPPTPARVVPPAGIVLRLGEGRLRLRQPSRAESGVGTAEAKPEE